MGGSLTYMPQYRPPGVPLKQRLANFSQKGQIVNILGGVCHKVSIFDIQPCYCSAKAAIDDP